jgi:AcrR family transcriptional regulator
MARPATGHEPTRQRLVAITRQLIAEDGVDAVALAEIATRAGLTVPTLYHYFRDRRSLILEALRGEIDDLLAAVAVSDAFADDPAVRLRVFLEKETDYLARTSANTVSFVLRSVLDSAQDDDLRDVAGRAFGVAESLFRGAFAEVAPGDPAHASMYTDVMRTFLAGLVLMRAVGAGVDGAAVSAEVLGLVSTRLPDAVRVSRPSS